MIFKVEILAANQPLRLTMDLTEDSCSDAAISRYLANGLPPEPEVVDVMARALKTGDLAVDAGANSGFFTLVMSKLVGDRGRVLAFEPDGRNLQRLKRNLDLNEAFNVEVIERPLWSKVESIEFYSYQDDGSNSHFGDNAEIATYVQATTLDEHIGGSSAPAFMKMDIEGAEYEALLGATYMIAHHTPMTVEMNHDALEKAGNGQDAVHNLMFVSGYQRFILHPDGSHPTFIPKGTAIRSKFANTNILYATFEQVQKMWPEVFL